MDRQLLLSPSPEIYQLPCCAKITIAGAFFVHCFMQTSYCVHPSPLGNLFISAEDDYITAVSFNESMVDVTPSPATRKCCEQLDEYFSGNRRIFELELVQKGTDFQQMVWTNLMNIPYGKTASYNQLSQMIGNVKAIRAVGHANGKNNIAIIVPCHRIIGSNGNLVGYAGKLWRKKWLLEHESKWAHGLQTLFS